MVVQAIGLALMMIVAQLLEATPAVAQPLINLSSALVRNPSVVPVQNQVPPWLGSLDPFRPVPDLNAVRHDPASPVLGNPNGDVTIVEFFDYHCPYCKRVRADLIELTDTDPGIRLVMKEYPILSTDSVEAAKAALAAADQDRYRPMHDALMAYRGFFTQSALESIAREAGVDPAKMSGAMKSAPILDQITKNLAEGRGLGFNGTPGFLFQDILVSGAISLDEMRELVATVRRKKQ